MSALVHTIGSAVSGRKRLWLAITFGFVALYYIGMLVSLMVRFEDLPNYITFYDWFGNVIHIIRSTPSVSDMIPIILEEWLVEIGYLNTDYGMGISEWSMSVIPPKVLVALFAGALIATATVLLLERRQCSATALNSASTTAGLGSLMVVASNLTMTWVVCCATPSWIVGLAMLGLSVATANALEPWGVWINSIGFLLLAGSVLWLGWIQSRDVAEQNEQTEHSLSGGAARAG